MLLLFNKIKHKFIKVLLYITFIYLDYYFGKNPILIYQKPPELNETLLNVATNSHEFVYNANLGILKQEISKKINENPYISVVMPMWNSENYIHRAIISVQNQNLSEYELIIINDYSSDNSSEIVNKLAYLDKRIKIINNEKHMGLFYSRCIGTLFSKGKYIFPLDSDDMYLVHDTLYFANIELRKNRPDFLLFRGIRSLNFTNFFENKNISIFRNYINNNTILYQPSIGMSYGHCSLQATCISKTFYKKIINSYSKYHFHDNITYCEDCITNHIMHQFAKSCELFSKIGYLNIYRESSSSHSDGNIYKRNSEIFYIDVLFKYTKICNNQSKMFSLKKFSDFIQNSAFKYVILDKKRKKMIKSLLIKIMNDKSISLSNKKFFTISIN